MSRFLSINPVQVKSIVSYAINKSKLRALHPLSNYLYPPHSAYIPFDYFTLPDPDTIKRILYLNVKLFKKDKDLHIASEKVVKKYAF